MSEPDFLSTSRIGILGLGLMGGSLALALHGRCQALLGCDINEETLILAKQLDTFDQLSANPADILPDADVVILATPLNTILRLIEELPSLHPSSAIVLDLGSTKAQVCQALAGLPERFDPLGGHPMCGKETIGLENAEAKIYQEAIFAFVDLERTSEVAKEFANQLALTIGSRALWIDAVTHDQWSAAVSHLPYLVATALSAATPTQSASLAGPGFRSTTRVAATPASIMIDVLKTNQGYVLESLERFRVEIDKLEDLIARNDFNTLNMRLDLIAERQQMLIAGPPVLDTL
jgi:prephenate dehydrogenase